jgi:NitT/TauT family transport system substrate-binding protein
MHKNNILAAGGCGFSREDATMLHSKTNIKGASRGVSRRKLLQFGGAAVAASSVFSPAILRAQVPTIRYATGGAIAPNEIETLFFTDFFRQNVLKRYGKEYNLEVTFTRGTPEAASLMAAGQVDFACLSFPIFAASVLKNAIPGGMSIVADIFQDGHKGYASNSFFVLEDGPKTIKDLKGKRIAVNAFGSAVDLEMRVALKKHGLDPKKDVQAVEVAFPNMGPALRERRVDAAVMVLPFMAVEQNKGGIREIFNGSDAFPTFSVIFKAARNDFLKAKPEVMRAWLADYVGALQWLYAPENRKKAVEVMAEFAKSPIELVDSYFLTNRDYFRDPTACVAAKNLQAPIDAMVQEGLLPERVDMSKFIDMSFLPHPCKA